MNPGKRTNCWPDLPFLLRPFLPRKQIPFSLYFISSHESGSLILIFCLTNHTVPHVTLLVSSGKFTSGSDFSGGRFFSFRGALLFTQGGTFWALKKAQQNSGGLKPLWTKMNSKALGRLRGKRSIDKRMKDTFFIVIETTVLLSKNLQNGYHLSIRGRLHR